MNKSSLTYLPVSALTNLTSWHLSLALEAPPRPWRTEGRESGPWQTNSTTVPCSDAAIKFGDAGAVVAVVGHAQKR